MKLSKTGIGLLTRQYRSVLHKCFLINIGAWNWVMRTTATGVATAALAGAAVMAPNEANAGVLCYNGTGGVYYYNDTSCADGTPVDLTYIKVNPQSAGTAEAVAYGSGDIAIGDGAVAGSNRWSYQATAIGTNAHAIGDQSTAMGHYAYASGYYSTALGYSAGASSYYSTALGVNAAATNQGSTALGFNAQAIYNNATALGYNSVAQGNSSIALGYNSVANEASTVSVGASSFQRRIVNVANGVNDHDAVTVGQLNSALSNVNNVNIDDALTNYYTKTDIDGAGYLTDTYIKVNVSSGAAAAVAYSHGDIAIGDGAIAGANGSVYYATAIGTDAYAARYGSTALGYSTSASGNYSTAVGGYAYANGNSTALGYDAQANGNYSTALGDGAQANAAGSIALGYDSIANEANTVSVGSASNMRRIVNVANGVNDHDAVTVGQLNSAISNVNIDDALTNYYTKNESDENSKRANLTTQNGDTLHKASNTFAESTNVPTHQASFTLANQTSLEITHNILQNGSSNNDSNRFANKANLPAKLLPPQSVGILNRKRFKMFADLLQQATNDNALTIATNVTTIAA